MREELRKAIDETMTDLTDYIASELSISKRKDFYLPEKFLEDQLKHHVENTGNENLMKEILDILLNDEELFIKHLNERGIDVEEDWEGDELVLFFFNTEDDE